MDIKYTDSYLESLIGKEVQVNKGGPESKRGVIKNVKPDYLVLYCNDNRLIWYQTKHIKSLIENSKTNFSQSTEDAVELDTPVHFVNMLDTLVSETVQVNQGGPESKVGKLLSVKQDFFVLLTKEDGNVCYLIDHVKSISLVQGEESEKENQTENVETDPNLLTEEREETKVNIENLEEYYKDIDNLDQLLSQMEYSLVSINRGGPEKLVGVLVDSSNDFLTIVVNEEVIRTSKFHLKSISQIINKEDNKDSSKNENEQTTEAKKEDQSENKDKGKNNESREKDNKKEGKEKEDKKNKKDGKEKEDKKNEKDDKEKEDKKNEKDDKKKEDKKK